MAINGGFVKVMSFFVNIICNVIVPVVESIAYKVKIGGGCECPSPPSSYNSSGSGRKHKKLKNNLNIGNGHHDVKRLKLLLDITVAQNGGKVLDVQASTPRGHHEEGYRDIKAQHCKKNPGFILTLLNLPSSIMLWFVRKLHQLAHSLETSDNPSCGDINRIKKSPKRRITRANYRKIIPFFPFNLLGFSNYSAFQMPSITRSSSSTAEETNTMNISTVSVNGNGKARSKRRRNTSTEHDSTCSSLSDDDISYLDLPEKSEYNTAETSVAVSGGHDDISYLDLQEKSHPNTGEAGAAVPRGSHDDMPFLDLPEKSHPSTEGTSDTVSGGGHDDMPYLDLQEKSYPITEENSVGGGHDEVDSDETFHCQ